MRAISISVFCFLYYNITMFSRPEKNIAEINVGEGMIVADFGTGGGAYILPLLKRVGEYGEVFAIDVQAVKLSRILNEAKRNGYRNISVVHSDLESKDGSHLKDKYCDRVIISNLLHKLEDKHAVFTEAKRVLKRTGMIAVVDWTDSFNLIGPHKDIIITKEKTIELAKRNKLTLFKEFNAGDHHYGLVFKLAKD